jgi:transcription antitermination factor NusG
MVLYTKPRSEKKVQEQLSLKGYEVYCPCQRILKQWSDRKKWVEEPIFKSYIFIKSVQSEFCKIDILQSKGVVRFLYWLGKPAEVKQVEIDAIKTFLGEYDCIQTHSFDQGSTLKVTEGMFKGAKGIVMYQTKNEIVLKIDQLGMSLSARISKVNVKTLRL